MYISPTRTSQANSIAYCSVSDVVYGTHTYCGSDRRRRARTHSHTNTHEERERETHMQRHNFVSNLIYGYNLYTTITQTIFHLRENSMRESERLSGDTTYGPSLSFAYSTCADYATRARTPTTIITLLLTAASHMDARNKKQQRERCDGE